VKDIADTQSRKLSHTIHSISVQKQLLEHKNQGLREALANKKRRQTKGKTLPFNQPNERRRGAVFWSPSRVQRARDALAQQEAKKQEQQHQKNVQREIQKANQRLKAQLLQERRVARAEAQEARARERAEKGDKRRLNQQARRAKQQLQNRIKLSKKGNKKASLSASRRNRAKKPVGAPEGVEQATPAPPTLSSRGGRIIKTPTRYL
jgi:hypothetical protein